jgi:MFS family permease
LTSVFPYLPEMIESFGIPQNDIARWAGLTSATFSICQSFTGIPWGAASDKFGRKPIILLGLCNTMITTLFWGFSTSLPMAITARALQGLGSGNVGILRTTVAELCPWKELQPRAFSIMPVVYTIGAIIGPTLGGALSNPLHIDPQKPRGSRFFERFPYSLPNLIIACFFTFGILVGWLFLKESLETKKHERDLGLITGAKITAWVRKIFHMPEQQTDNTEREPLLAHKKAVDDEEQPSSDTPANITPQGPPKLREVLNYQTTLNLVAYTLLALYSLAYDQLLPVFMHHPPMANDDPRVSLPLKFAGGFGIGSRRIGAIFTFLAVASMIFQFFMFPPLAQKLGVLRCLRISFLIYPFVFFVTPFVSLLPSQLSKEIAMVTLLMFRGLGGTFAFPTSTILLTNSASSLRILGTVNGLATTVSAVGRAVGPAMGGSLFTLGVKHGYIILPFWTLTVISLIGSIPTWWLVEGKGFGDDPEDEGSVSAASSDATGIGGPEGNTDDLRSESEYGEPTSLLGLTSTHSSAAILSEDDSDMDTDEAERRRSDRRGPSDSFGQSRRRSQNRQSGTARRRSSVPIGMGVGFRKLSSNLGSTGIGAEGTSWGGT